MDGIHGMRPGEGGLWTLGRWKEAFRQVLSGRYGILEAGALFYWAAEEITGKSKARLLADMRCEVRGREQERFGSVLERLGKGEPVQYVFGKAFFAGMALEVGPGVLIPRPETEELLQWACASLQGTGGLAGARILDLCTGSGALALALSASSCT